MTWSCDPELLSSVLPDYVASGPMLYNAIGTFLTTQCLLAPTMFPDPTSSDIIKAANTTYDFIIVGAGTAGAVVANRLSENAKWSILLLEAGGNPTLGTEIPALYGNNYGTKEDWNFRTESQKHACLSYKNQKCYWPRGKVLGGTSSINGMFYIRGNRHDYDEWSVPGWSYQSLEGYFKKSENLTVVNGPGDVDMHHHGTGGYLNVEYDHNIDPLEKILIKANEEIGSRYVKDLNGPTQMGVGISFIALKNGKRQSTSNAFLRPITNRSNLHVLTNVYVEQVIFEDNTAKGVNVVSQNGAISSFFVNKEIILSAGTINSPVILLNSNLKTKSDDNINNEMKTTLPIGENLQDHVYALILFKSKSTDDSNSLGNIFKAYYEYVTEQKGPFSSLSPHRVVSFINTTASNATIPDIQNHFIIVYPNQSNSVDIFGKHGLSSEFYEAFSILNKDHLIIMVYVNLLRPKSKGFIKLNKIDRSPKIEANYLSDQDDLDTIVRGMKHAMKLENTAAFKNAGLKLHWIKIYPCSMYDEEGDEFLKCIAKHLTGTLYHAVGTNKMGTKEDQSSVVDEHLKVKSANNLRVIDASVMPNIVRGNTMAPVIMIAEKGSDLIKSDWCQ